jgi:hypothetical protein
MMVIMIIREPIAPITLEDELMEWLLALKVGW